MIKSKKNRMNKKILTVIGARPQFIKASVISRLIEKNFKNQFTEVIVHSGQHYDNNMSSIFFKDLKIKKPKYNLNIGSMNNSAQVGAIMTSLERIIRDEVPDLVLTYGDTNTTLAAALVASKIPVKLAHIEAGLRSNRFGMPEEVNRIITDRLSQFLFCPTDSGFNNLKREGIIKNVFVTGDIMLDSFNYVKSKSISTQFLKKNNILHDTYIFATIHRAENVDNYETLKNIIESLNFLSNKKNIIFSIHPRTKKNIEKFDLKLSEKLKIIDPQSYPTVVNLISSSFGIITDSGGLQKEAYFAKKPCITFRDETEWIETTKLGYNKLFPPAKLPEETKIILKTMSNMPKEFPSIFGNGKCGVRILEILQKLI